MCVFPFFWSNVSQLLLWSNRMIVQQSWPRSKIILIIIRLLLLLWEMFLNTSTGLFLLLFSQNFLYCYFIICEIMDFITKYKNKMENEPQWSSLQCGNFNSVSISVHLPHRRPTRHHRLLQSEPPCGCRPFLLVAAVKQLWWLFPPSSSVDVLYILS